MSGSERSNDTAGHNRACAGWRRFLKRHLEACLRGDLQKSRSICAANKPRDFSASPFDLRLPFGAAPFGPNLRLLLIRAFPRRLTLRAAFGSLPSDRPVAWVLAPALALGCVNPSYPWLKNALFRTVRRLLGRRCEGNAPDKSHLDI